MTTEPTYGGTLRYLGPGGMDHIDPSSAYYALSHQIIRLFARQLFTYPSRLDALGLLPAPDAAVKIPEPGDGLSDDRRVYRIQIRDGVLWDTDPPREVTAEDFIRGFKRMCNPVAGAGALTYYTSTIAGMEEFAEGYRKEVSAEEPTADQLAAYQRENDIVGLRADGPKTLIIELIEPASDFLNILSMTFASAAPVEYDEVVPASDAFWRHSLSNGPYRITDYQPGERLLMERNPAWAKDSDPIRNQHVEHLQVTIGATTPDRLRSALLSGETDLSWGAPIIGEHAASDSHRRLGFALNPYLVFNLHSPNANGAMADLRVRQAIAYAIDKVTIAGIFSELDTRMEFRPAHTAIPPGNLGHREHNPFPTPGDRGDPARSRALLDAAGYNELALKLLYREADVHPEVAQSIAGDLRRCGIEATLVATSQSDDYYRVLQNPNRARTGEWDITAPSWTPDWFGNNGRALVQPMFQSNSSIGTANYGGFEDPEVDRLIVEALRAGDDETVADLLHQVDRLVTERAAIVPILVHEPTIPHLTSNRVRNGIQLPHVDRWFDAANLWLDPVEP